MAPVELERYGRPYWECPACPYGANDRAYVTAHMRDHEPRQTLDEFLAAQAEPAPAPPKPRKSKE